MCLVLVACGSEDAPAAEEQADSAAVDDTDTTDTTDTATIDSATADTAMDVAIMETAVDAARPPIAVVGDGKRHDFTFKANDADPAAKQSLGNQGAYLDTGVKSKGKLVVYLHGASDAALTNCTNGEVANVVTAMGYHLFTPCYNSYYGVDKCKDDIGGCRLEAFEGVDHTPVIDIAPADAIEPRIVAAMKYLKTKYPGGDWGYFLDGDKPRWSDIIIAGISHGASSAGIIGKVRATERVVMLSGPLDTKQAWLSMTSLTPVDRVFGFTHTADPQHPGHLEAFETMKLPGTPTSVDGAKSPYGGSHRLQTSAATSDGHSSTQPGGSSPKSGGMYVFLPVWKYLFGG